jgi:voltage-gated potassium channel
MELNKNILYEVIFSILALVAVSIALLDIIGKITLVKGTTLYYIDFSILVIFIIDYFIRLIVSESKKSFIRNNIPDLIAIIPFNSMFKIFRTFKLVKAVKIVRLSKLTKLGRFSAFSLRFYKKTEKFFKTNGLIYVLIFSISMLFVSSIAISVFENMSFKDSVWWAFVTATTVGYGDLSPSTSIGRIIAALLMLVGIGTIGMLTGTIATYFLNPKEDTPETGKLVRNILESNELLDYEKSEIINYMNYLKAKRISREQKES